MSASRFSFFFCFQDLSDYEGEFQFSRVQTRYQFSEVNVIYSVDYNKQKF